MEMYFSTSDCGLVKIIRDITYDYGEIARSKKVVAQTGYLNGGRSIKTKDIGDLGESFAAEFLEKSGYCIVARNYRIKSGEDIDIIAVKNGIWRLIEVKTRTSLDFGYPSESVDKNKIRRMSKCFVKFLKERGLESEEYEIEIFEILINHMTNYLQTICKLNRI